MSIAPNPSHLEAVNPVVMGLVRAVQTRLGSGGRTAVAGLLIHGDAAFAGLGIVAECLQLSNTPGKDPRNFSTCQYGTCSYMHLFQAPAAVQQSRYHHFQT